MDFPTALSFPTLTARGMAARMNCMGAERMNTILRLSLAACAVFWSCRATALATVADNPAIYVATDGNDAWSGTLPAPNPGRTDGPVATPAKARNLAREILAHSPGKPVRVVLRGGTYLLDGALTLTPADSGAPSAPAVWEAYRDEKPILSGGVRLTGWTPAPRSTGMTPGWRRSRAQTRPRSSASSGSTEPASPGPAGPSMGTLTVVGLSATKRSTTTGSRA